VRLQHYGSNERAVSGRRLLDAGCAAGYFLEVARVRGWMCPVSPCPRDASPRACCAIQNYEQFMSAIMANGWARPDPAPNSSSWREAPLPGHSTYRIQPCHVRQSARRNHDSREASIQVDAARRRLSLKARDAPFAQFAERLADTLLQVRGILESATNTGEIGRHADSSLPVRGLRATRHLRRTSVLRNWPLGACSDVVSPHGIRTVFVPNRASFTTHQDLTFAGAANTPFALRVTN
jgi:hypothetical protein